MPNLIASFCFRNPPHVILESVSAEGNNQASNSIRTVINLFNKMQLMNDNGQVINHTIK